MLLCLFPCRLDRHNIPWDLQSDITHLRRTSLCLVRRYLTRVMHEVGGLEAAACNASTPTTGASASGDVPGGMPQHGARAARLLGAAVVFAHKAQQFVGGLDPVSVAQLLEVEGAWQRYRECAWGARDSRPVVSVHCTHGAMRRVRSARH